MSQGTLDVELFDPDRQGAALVAGPPVREIDHPGGLHSAPDQCRPGELTGQDLDYVGWLIIW